VCYDGISHGTGTMVASWEFPCKDSEDSDVGDVWLWLLVCFHRVTHNLRCDCALRFSPYLAQFPF
jgi:hypothetical protein